MARDVRPVDATRVVIGATIAALLAAVPLAAQASNYGALVDQYASGNARDAIATLATYSPATIAAVSSMNARAMSPARQRAAVMLHTDTAYTLLTLGGISAASVQVVAARRILAAMRSGNGADAHVRAFEARWFAFSVSMYTAQGRLDEATLLVRDGFGLYPREPLLYVARGVISEMSAPCSPPIPASAPASLRGTDGSSRPPAIFCARSRTTRRSPSRICISAGCV